MMLPHTDGVMAMEATFLRGVIVVASVMLAFVAGAQQAATATIKTKQSSNWQVYIAGGNIMVASLALLMIGPTKQDAFPLLMLGVAYACQITFESIYGPYNDVLRVAMWVVSVCLLLASLAPVVTNKLEGMPLFSVAIAIEVALMTLAVMYGTKPPHASEHPTKIQTETQPQYTAVAIGTTNKCKCSALKRAFGSYPSIANSNSILPCKVASGVPDQPLGYDITVTGARNRSEAAYAMVSNQIQTNLTTDETSPTKLLAVGIESGIVEIAQRWFDVTAVSIFDGTCHRIGLSTAFEVPTHVMKHVHAGLELCDAIKAAGLTSDDLIGQHEGLIGVLTEGRTTREDYTVHGIEMALLCTDKHRLYPQ
eukprot:m.71963 g.71963  ORF g.71963 m.71963 type:complete len:366 (-) comp24409_c0_seq1:431-1528(-)